MTGSPTGWAETKLGEIAAFVTSGSRGWAKYYSDDGAAFVRVGNVKRGTIALDWSDMQRVQPPPGAEGERTRLQPGDVLVTITADLGRVAVFSPRDEDAYINQHVALVRLIDPEWASYVALYLASSEGQSQLLERDKGTTKAGLGLEDINSVAVPFPPVAEQRRIVAQLDCQTARAARARADLDRVPALVDRYRKAVMAQLFEAEPEDKKPLADVVDEGLIGLVRSRSEQGFGAGVPYVRMQHFDFSGRWNDDDLTRVQASSQEVARFALRAGDVLFNTRNSVELVGKVALCTEAQQGWLYNNNLLRLRFVQGVLPAFAFRQMQSPVFRAHLEDQKSATTSVAAIYQGSLFRTPFWVPSLGRQAEIVSRIEAAFAEIDRLAVEAVSARRLLDRLDQAILAKAFRGELVPQDPADEPASALLARIKAEREDAPANRRGRRPKAA